MSIVNNHKESSQEVSVWDVKPLKDTKVALYNAFSALPARKSNEIGILSFNTQYKKWTDDTDYPYIKNNEWRTWEYRLPRLRQMIACYKSDIICLQEIDKHDFQSDFGDYFENLNYSWVVNTTKKNKIAMANAFLFNKNKFDCIWSENRSRAMLLLLKLKHDCACVCNKYNNKQFNTQSKQQNNNNNNKDNQQDNCNYNTQNTSNQTLCSCNSLFVVNVHLQAGPDQAKTRYNQINSILSSIDKKIKKIISENNLDNNKENRWNIDDRNKINLIICGDFNSGIFEETEKYLLTNQIEANWTFGEKNPQTITDELLTHKWCFYDAYRNLNTKFGFDNKENGGRIKHTLFPTFAAYNVVGCLDHFYYSQSSMQCIGVCHTLPKHRRKEYLDNLVTLTNSQTNKVVEKQMSLTNRIQIDDNDDTKRNKDDNGNETENENENILEGMLNDCWFPQNGDKQAWLQLPDGELVSDHLPICGVFKLNQCSHFNDSFRCCMPIPPKSSKKKNKKAKQKGSKQQNDKKKTRATLSSNKKIKSKHTNLRGMSDIAKANQFHEVFTF